MEVIRNAFAFLGVGMMVMILVIALQSLIEWICDTIRNIRWSYKYRSRFHKKPRAKCYCYDCENYSRENQPCMFSKVYVGAIEFCSRATPLKKDPDIKNGGEGR